MNTCLACGIQFVPKQSNSRYCTRKCYKNLWRRNNPTKHYNRSDGKSKRLSALMLKDKLKSVPCMDCGRSFPPYVMDFDHVRGRKSYEISRVRSMAKVLAEVGKCDVVCSNCHRIRTHSRGYQHEASAA
jgi:uncharacterized OB-fold protein